MASCGDVLLHVPIYYSFCHHRRSCHVCNRVHRPNKPFTRGQVGFGLVDAIYQRRLRRERGLELSKWWWSCDLDAMVRAEPLVHRQDQRCDPQRSYLWAKWFALQVSWIKRLRKDGKNVILWPFRLSNDSKYQVQGTEVLWQEDADSGEWKVVARCPRFVLQFLKHETLSAGMQFRFQKMLKLLLLAWVHGLSHHGGSSQCGWFSEPKVGLVRYSKPIFLILWEISPCHQYLDLVRTSVLRSLVPVGNRKWR
jgi:hypothetical protein